MLTFVYGGCHCGKSTWTLEQAAALPCRDKVFVAAMVTTPDWAESVARQRRERAAMGFTATVEASRDIAGAARLVPKGAAVVLECLCHLTANELFSGASPDGPRAAADRMMAGIELLSDGRELFVVSNEVAADGAVYDPETELYKLSLSTLNRLCAARAERVYEVVCGLATRIK